MILRDDPGGEVALDGVCKALVGRTGILVHGNLHVVAVLLYCGQSADLIQAALPGLACGHSAVQGNGAGVGHCAAAGGGEEDFGNRNGSAAQEVGFLVLGVVFLVQHFHKALYFLVVGSVVLVQSAHVLKDVGHLVDGVVAALRSGAVAGNALDVHTDLHTASLAAVDAAVGGLGGNHEVRADLILVDDVLPAKAVAVLFLNRTGYQNGVLVGEQSQILHDLSAVNRADDTAALVGHAASADLGVVLVALVGIKVPVVLVADANGVDVGVKTD